MLTASLAAASLAQARVGRADDSSPRCTGARRPDHRSRQPAHGFVDVYTTSGACLKRFATHGVLNSLWGITLAPVSFGQFSNDLLIGNFGDERIHAFDPKTGEVLGVLRGTSGVPLAIDGLWGLIVGDPGSVGWTRCGSARVRRRSRTAARHPACGLAQSALRRLSGRRTARSQVAARLPDARKVQGAATLR
jgi:hypothetical protein